MITGELKNKVDSIWDTLWTGGIASPITVLEQITYLMFMKLLDDNQLKAEANANALGVPLKNKVFKEGVCVISENPRVETDYNNLRWHVFHNFEPSEMLYNIQNYVFPFIKTIGEGKDTAFSRYMKDTVFLIPTAKVLAKVVDGIDDMDMNNKDIMGDVYEYLLGKIAAAGENGQFRTPRHIINMIVELMKPTLKDRILDPAMGSAGFLLSAAAYVGEHQKQELMRNENLKYFKKGMFFGLGFLVLLFVCFVYRAFRKPVDRDAQERQMKKVATLLKTTDKSLAEIAIEVGEKKVSCLERKFRKAYKVAPLEYRRKND